MPRKFSSAEVEITAKDRTKPGIDSAKGGIGRLTQMVKSYGAEIGAAVAVVVGAMRTIKDLTQAYIDQEDAVVGMDNALRATGVYTPQFSSELQNLAGALQGTTKFSDETILSMAGMLQQMGRLTQDGLKKMIPAVLDMATSLKMDLNQAATLVGKSIGSNTNALARYGLELKEGMTQTEKMGALQDWIAGRFRGSAAAMAGTFGGKLTVLKNLFGEVKESIGKMLLEQGAPFINWLIDFLKNGENIQVIGKIIMGLGATFTTVFSVIITAIKTTINYYKIWGEAIIATSKILGVLFDPKKWGSGEIKKAFEDLKMATVAIAEDTWNMWIKQGKMVGDAWAKTFKSVDYTITTTASNMNYLGEEFDTAIGKMKNYSETVLEYKDELVRATVAGDAYYAMLYETDLAANQVATSVTNAADAIAAFSSRTEPMVEEITAVQTALAYFKDYVVNEFQPDLVNAWESIWTSTGDTFKKIKDAFKGMVADFLIGLAKLYVGQAVALMFLGVWGRAAKLLLASAALYAAAGVVRSLAKGGEFVTQGPELIQVGDNPSGRERVSVTPAESPAYNQQQSGGPIGGDVYFDGVKMGKWIAREVRAKNIPIYQGALVST
jgi:hypothetical protein